MIKGFKIRLYPNKEQESLIWEHIGASRFIWNYMLDIQQDNYKKGGKYINRFGMCNLLTPLKRVEEYSWLNSVSNSTLQCVCADLNDAYARFFKGAGFPKYKSKKRSKPTFPIRCDCLYFSERYAVVQKIGKIKYKTDFRIPVGKGNKFTNIRLSYINGKYMLSFGMECENQALELSDNSMGIDLGIKELAVVAYGDKEFVFHNINKSQKIRLIKKHIRHLQRDIFRKYESSRKRNGGKYIKTENIKRGEKRLARLYAKIKNIYSDYLHQITHKLVCMAPARVVMEDLNVSSMMKNKHLSKYIGEQCFSEFIRKMRYKCSWYGIQFQQADRFYPSSKTCSCCGAIKKDLKLSDRTYICVKCGLSIDRDYNAAINLSKYTG